MLQREGNSRWSAHSQIPIFLTLSNGAGLPVLGASPQVAISRYSETHGNALDGWFWDGVAFQVTPTWFTMLEIDALNLPGLYTYLFRQDIIGLEHTYLVYTRHTSAPVGFNSTFHVVTNEVYIPMEQPDPVIVGPQTVMGQLELVKGLLHHNSMLDRQTYLEGQLTGARLRVFDNPANVPNAPDGDEVIGKIAEFQIVSEYDDQGLNKKFVLKRVYP